MRKTLPEISTKEYFKLLTLKFLLVFDAQNQSFMMKKYFLAFYMILGSFLLHAQAPCSDFNSTTNPAGNWVAAPYPDGNVYTSFSSSTPADGSQYLVLGDGSGSSWYLNTTDFKYIGEIYQGQCLSFDFYLKDDGGYGSPIYPTINLSDGISTITFVSSTAVTPGSGWITVKAPIQFANGSLTPPSNAYGSWQMNGYTPAAFDNVLMTGTILGLCPDYYPSPSEIVYYDNICITDCGGCSADFKLTTSFNTTNHSAIADLSIINPSISSTPGNPGSSYIVSWGDGAITSPYILPSVSHTYSDPGSYTICVTEVKEKEIVCKKCITFCYSESEGKTIVQKSSTTLPDWKNIAKAELENTNELAREYALIPNPAKNYVDLQTNLSAKSTVSVKIISLVGETVLEKSEKVNNGRQAIRLNTEKLIQGTYIVEIQSNGKVSSQKLIISK
ncbi:T9SS type A sorting domain-containing protein [Chryseobacterium sp. RG1]|uniref:T9SS type A sorting domain-containing protein n=1 Tax=Chryseobacterium tagetis TaxID=2801334 RepID=A0ABS7ZXU3_9FLAO|nr:T9SS type A sorting domain-containing protein [Chryseobacterium tagetis]MCA6066554.1 T9SS type A sorting domain-containing protein [Chryseobacterium tagetis]